MEICKTTEDPGSYHAEMGHLLAISSGCTMVGCGSSLRAAEIINGREAGSTFEIIQGDVGADKAIQVSTETLSCQSSRLTDPYPGVEAGSPMTHVHLCWQLTKQR